jgi:hypothetical protein
MEPVGEDVVKGSVVDIRSLTGHHPDDDCPGLNDCPQMQAIWRDLAGGRAGVCVLCYGVHWPWEPHRTPGPS